MELRTLRALVEVVRSGGFSAAGRALFASQPTVSKAVRQLEDELGLELLERLSHGIRLTQAGEIVFRRAQSMLAEAEDLRAELDELRGLARGELRLGLPPLGSNTLFAPLFAIYRARHPQVDIRLIEHGSQRLEEAVLAGEIELAGSLLPVAEGFDSQPVRREPLVALLPPGHPQRDAQKVTLRQLRETPFILFERGFALNRRILDACQARGFAPIEAARSGQIDFIVALVAAGIGVALLPRMIAAERPHPQVHYALLDEADLDWHMALVWRRGAFLSHAAQAWLDLAREYHGPQGTSAEQGA